MKFGWCLDGHEERCPGEIRVTGDNPRTLLCDGDIHKKEEQ